MKHAWLRGAALALSCLVGSAAVGQVSPARAVERNPKSVHQGESATPTLVSSGNFVGLAHETSGKASIYATQDGKRILRLEQFKTSNGPDVRVYLVKGSNAADNDIITTGGFVDPRRAQRQRR